MLHYVQNAARGDEDKASMLASALDIELTLARLLCRRGYDTVEAASAFLNPCSKQLCDPFLFEDMLDATDCIFAAVDGGEKICVYGDYDVDGVMSVSMLVRFLRTMGADVISYIPSRHTEGYGLNTAAIDKLAEEGVSLLITVDCGVTALVEVQYATESGMEVIVTDHHQCLDELPECAAVINPARPNTPYPYKYLCGAGVVLKLIHALGGESAAAEYLDFAAIATVADIVPLTGENRVIVTLGLKKMNEGGMGIGVRALSDAAGYKDRTIDAGAIGYALAPRINAAGRTGLSQRSLDLFLTDDRNEAKRLAAALDEENRNRQAIEAQILEQALAMIKAGAVDIVDDSAILLADERWNPGVIGIVASRLIELYNKPVILFAIDGDLCIGSARSIRKVNMFQALLQFSDLFVRFGGHEMAAGLTIKQSNRGEFFVRFKEYLQEVVPQEVYLRKAFYDADLNAKETTLEFAQELRQLAPFGIGNAAPVFRFRSITPKNPRTIGSDKSHLSFALDQEGSALDCTAFSMGSRIAELSNASCDMLFSLDVDDFRGAKKAKCMVRYLRTEPPADVATHINVNVWKFHDAFYDSIRYNDSYGEKEAEKTDDAFAMVQSLFCSKVQGTLVLCFTPEGATALLAFLQNAQLFGSLELGFGTMRNEGFYNAIVFAPLLDAIDLSGYKTIVVVDDCLTAGTWSVLSSQRARIVVAGHYAEAFVQQLPVARETLIPVYKTMLQLALTQTVFISKEDYFSKLCAYLPAIGKEIISFALRVFGELGFLRVEAQGAFRVEPVQNAPQKNLSQSTTYTKTANAFAEYKLVRGGTA